VDRFSELRRSDDGRAGWPIRKEHDAVVPNVIGKDRHARLELVLKHSGPVIVEVVDAQGKTTRTFNAQLPQGSGAVELELHGFAPGSYVLKVRGAAHGAVRVVLE